MEHFGGLKISWALVKSWSPLHHTGLLKTITYDNGKGNSRYQQTYQIFVTHSFFARPYRSRDKDNVEQCIELVRKFLPKKTNLTLP